MVSVLAFYIDDPSSNPADDYSFFSVKFVFEKNENKQIEALGAHLIKKIEGPQEVPNLHSFTIHGITGSRDY